MKSRLTICVSEELWNDALEKLQERFQQLQKILKCNSWHCFGDGVEKAPCSTELWRQYIRVEHDEHTCYFRHWFKKIDGKPTPTPFSHLALMPLIRSCIWQTLLAEFITGRLAGRDAVRLRVEDELEHYSNLKSSDIRHRIGSIAQDWFGIIKNHLKATDRPLNRAGLSGASKLVVELHGLDYRSKRKGWSNRNFRKELAKNLIESGIADIPTRSEQEAFIYNFISSYDNLKQSALKAILKLLANYFDEDGVCVLRPWSKSELSEIRREAREKGCFERLMERRSKIVEKIIRGERLTQAERLFKHHHKELFDGSEQKSICNRK